MGVAYVLTLQRTASHCNTLQRVLQCIQYAQNILVGVACVLTLQRTASHCNTPQRVLQCLQYAQHIRLGVMCVVILQRAASHCNTLQHTEHTATPERRASVSRVCARGNARVAVRCCVAQSGAVYVVLLRVAACCCVANSGAVCVHSRSCRSHPIKTSIFKEM